MPRSGASGARPRRGADRHGGAGHAALHDLRRRRIPAFTQNYAVLPVDALRRGHRSRRISAKSNFDAVANDAIDAALPLRARAAPSGAPRAALLSDSAEHHPARGGARRSGAGRRARTTVALPVSDTVDLYLKGMIERRRSDLPRLRRRGDVRPRTTRRDHRSRSAPEMTRRCIRQAGARVEAQTPAADGCGRRSRPATRRSHLALSERRRRRRLTVASDASSGVAGDSPHSALTHPTGVRPTARRSLERSVRLPPRKLTRQILRPRDRLHRPSRRGRRWSSAASTRSSSRAARAASRRWPASSAPSSAPS